MDPATPDVPANKNLHGHHDLQLNVPAPNPALTSVPVTSVPDPAPAPAADTTWHMPEPEAEKFPAEPAAVESPVFTSPAPAATFAPAAPAAAPDPVAAWHMPDSGTTGVSSVPALDPVADTPVPSVTTSAWTPTPPAPPVSSSFDAGNVDPTRPVPVVRVLSPVGVEYVFMTISLVLGAIGLTTALLVLVNGELHFSVLAFPVALLLVSLPAFALFFLHLKKLETNNPQLQLDASKRRSTQFTQIASFVVIMFTLIGLMSAIFAKLGGESHVSILKVILDALCVLVVAGGILFYYWRDEHKV